MEVIVTTPDVLKSIVDNAVRSAVYELKGVINGGDEIIDEKEVCEILGGIKPKSLWRHKGPGKLEPINGRGNRFYKHQVLEYAKSL